jgi:hypothetical protein
MRTVFIYKGKKLFEIAYAVYLDVGDIVEHDRKEYDAVVPNITNYRVTGRKFRNDRAFSGIIEIFLVKKK